MSPAPTRLTNGAAMTCPESADALNAVVRAERTELKRTLGELESAVRHKMDVRSRLQDHPLTTVGVACAAGVVLGVLSNRMPPDSSSRDEDRSGRLSARRLAGAMTVATTPFATMAASVTTLVAQRLADVAEEALRRVLKPRSS